MNKEQFTDQQLLKAIRQSAEEREKAAKYLFHHEGFRSIVSEIVEKGGGNDSYETLVFENCLIQLDKLVRRNQYTANNLATFFESEARLNWSKVLISDVNARQIALNFLAIDKDLKGKIHTSIRKNSGTNEDAQDIYQNGLILINKHLQEGKFRGGAIKGFLYQVCYNLWRNELKKSKTMPLPEDGVDFSASTFIDPQEVLEQKERAKLLDKLFEQLSESCRKLLRLKFLVIDNFSMGEISQKMGFKNAQIAANALSKCRKRLWTLLEKHKPAFEWIRSI